MVDLLNFEDCSHKKISMSFQIEIFKKFTSKESAFGVTFGIIETRLLAHFHRMDNRMTRGLFSNRPFQFNNGRALRSEEGSRLGGNHERKILMACKNKKKASKAFNKTFLFRKPQLGFDKN